MPFRRNWLTGCAWWLLAAATVHAQPTVTLTADIAPQPLYRALDAFAAQTGLQVVYLSEVVGARKSRGAKAGVSVSAALDQLLDGTGLDFEFVNDRTVSIVAAASVQPAGYRFELAGVQASDPVGAAATLEEIVVTATRREARVSDVPISMAVWSEAAMEASGVKGMTEIGALTPGLGFDWFAGFGAGAYTNLGMRGVTGRRGATTGIFVGDTPLLPGWHDTYVRSFPATFDLDRVEILRGPQGTLLGQGTLGGAIRFIPNEPSLTMYSSHARTEWATTAYGDISYEAGAAAGGPVVADVLGVRVSGWYRSEGGFVDRVDPFTGATVDRDANRIATTSARAAMTWAPTGSVRITPSLVYESYSTPDPAAFSTYLSDPSRGDLRNASLTQQPLDDAFSLASLKLTAGFAAMDLIAVTSLFDRSAAGTFDSTDYAAQYTDTSILRIDVRQRVLSQEVRLASADPDAMFTWLAGAFYSDADTRAANKVVHALAPVDGQDATVIDQSQLEGYVQFSRRIGKRLTASAGWRVGRASYEYATEVSPTFHGRGDESSVTPRFDLSYQTERGSLFYLSAAEGYRSGGVVPALPGVGPSEFPSDSVWSYEIGTKNDLLAGRAHLEASVFHSRWNNDRQEAVAFDGVYTVLGGRAASNGIELAAQARLTERLKIGAAISYIDAHYTETVRSDDAVIAREGATVDMARPPWNVSASIDYEFPVMSDVTAEVRVEDIFRGGDRGRVPDDDPASAVYDPDARPQPSMNLLNLRATVRWPTVDLSLFVNNALDSQPLLDASFRGNAQAVGTKAYTFTPRTVGLSAAWRL